MTSVLGALFGNDPVERFIHRLSIFEPLETEARDGLRRAILRGPLIAPLQELREDAPQDVSILLTGWLCHFRLLDNGRRQITSLVVPGDFVDFGFLAQSSAQLQCVSTAPSQLGRIKSRLFAELAETYPSLMRACLRASATQAAIGQERIISLGVRTAAERISFLLCELWHRLSAVGMVGPDDSYELPMTQSELGAALGLSTVHVNRTLQALRRSGGITMRSGKVWILDLRQLTQLSGFDPAYLNSPP